MDYDPHQMWYLPGRQRSSARPLMDETPTPPASEQRSRAINESPFMSIVSALLFLYVGFGLGLVGVSGDPLYDGSVTAFVWMAKIVGIGMLAVAAMIYARLQLVYPVNFVLALLATVGCLAAGAVWLAYGDGSGILILIFGLLNAGGARSAWLIWRSGRGVGNL